MLEHKLHNAFSKPMLGESCSRVDRLASSGSSKSKTAGALILGHVKLFHLERVIYEAVDLRMP